MNVLAKVFLIIFANFVTLKTFATRSFPCSDKTSFNERKATIVDIFIQIQNTSKHITTFYLTLL
jgi:hypothetical protein